MSCALSLDVSDAGTLTGAVVVAGSSSHGAEVSATGAVAGALVSVVAVCFSAVAPAGASSPQGR